MLSRRFLFLQKKSKKVFSLMVGAVVVNGWQARRVQHTVPTHRLLPLRLKSEALSLYGTYGTVPVPSFS
jgi:hypothetical protein